MNEGASLTQEQLQALCCWWQDVLRLQDWQVVVHTVRGRDMKFPQVAGEIGWTEDRKEAVVRILDPVDYEPSLVYAQDMELSLVHELLHLHFALIATKDDTIEDTIEEQALHLIAAALVALKRNGGSTK